MTFRFFLFVAAVGWSACCGWPARLEARGSEALPRMKQLRAGFGGVYKLGAWTAFDVALEGGVALESQSSPVDDGRRRLWIQSLDDEAINARYRGPTVSLPGQTTYRVYARVGRERSPLTVMLGPAGDGDRRQAPAEPQVIGQQLPGEGLRPISATTEWIVELGGDLGIDQMLRRAGVSESDRPTIVALEGDEAVRAMPDRWYGYEGVDLVAIVGAELADDPPDEAAVEALWQWCRLGGSVVIACGAGAEKLVGPGAPFARFLPGEFGEMRDLRQFVAIESYAAATQPLDSGVSRLSLRVPEVRKVRGTVELAEPLAANLPLIVRRRVGFGEVTFVGLDLHRPPFVQWVDRSTLLEKVLDRPRKGQADAALLAAAAAHTRRLGFIDLAGQLRGALDQIEGVLPIPFWMVSTLVIAYIGAMFPLTFFVCHRWLNRPRLAWLMLPAVAAAFGGTGYVVAHRAKGDQLRMNQVDVVDVDQPAGLVRGASWFSLFSPENAAYDLRARPRFADGGGEFGPGVLSWFGLPGEGFGGMSSRAEGTPLFDQPYEISASGGEIDGVPLPIWSSRSFTTRWGASAAQWPGGIEANVARTFDQLLEGTLTSRLDWPLENCVVLYGQSACRFDRIEPGEAVELSRGDFAAADTFLTRRDPLAIRDAVPPYDRAGFDLQRILEVMMFHEASGGGAYSGLLNRYQRFVDLSEMLDDRGLAIVLGNGPAATAVEVAGADAPPTIGRRVSIYRFIVPVRQSR